jgi:hypothetical protein
MSQLKELTVEELNVFLPKLITVLKKTSKNKTLYAPEIIQGFNDNKHKWGVTTSFCPARLRKLVSHIRINGLLPIMSGPTGYYVTSDKKEIIEMAKSLESRAEAISAGAKGLRDYAQEIENEETYSKRKEDYDPFFDEIEKTSDPQQLYKRR